MCCKKLVSLNLSRVAVTPHSLKMLTEHCNALKVGEAGEAGEVRYFLQGKNLILTTDLDHQRLP